MQHEFGAADARVVGAARERAAAGKFAGHAEVDQHVAHLQRGQAACELAAHRAQRQALLVEGAGRAGVVDADAAGDIAVRANPHGQRDRQLGAGQRRIEKARVDAAPVDGHLSQRDGGERRQRESGVAERGAGLAVRCQFGGGQVAAGAQVQLGRFVAGLRCRLGQAGGGVELERPVCADAAVRLRQAQRRHRAGVLQMPL